MNQRSDLDRTLEIWMADGPTTISDRFVDVVSGRIGRTRQRRSWRLPWRPVMKRYLAAAAGLAAVIVLVVAAWRMLPGSDVGTQPTPTPTTQPTAQPSASPETVRDLPDGAIAAGRYRFQPFGEASSLSVIADIPSGWNGFEGGWALLGPGTDERADAVAIVFIEADRLYSDPCHWDLDGTGQEGQPGDVVVGSTVEDLVAALKANASYTSSAATPVTFGQFEGQELELQLPSNIPFETCDQDPGGEGRYFVFSGPSAGLYAQGDGNRWHLYIVDVGGTRVIVVRLDYEGTPAVSRDAANAIVESLEFTP